MPRYTFSEDAAELLEYDGRLWLYSIDPATNLVYEVSKRSD